MSSLRRQSALCDWRTDLVQKVRTHIGAVFPDNCSEVWIHANLLKVIKVFQRLEDFAVQFLRQVNQAFAAVVLSTFPLWSVPENQKYLLRRLLRTWLGPREPLCGLD